MNKILYGIAIAMVALFTACDQDNEAAIYRTNFQNVSFEQEEFATIMTNESEVSIPVRITRALTNGAYTATFALASDNEGIFSVESNSVSFENGQGSAVVNVKASNLQKGFEYACTLTLSEQDIAQNDTITRSANNEIKLNVMCDWNWLSIGKGHYNSPEWWEEEFDVTIMKAEGATPSLYKIISLFQKGYDIQFQITPENYVIVPKQGSWVHSSYGVVSLQGYYTAGDYTDVAGLYHPDTKVCDMTLQHTVSAGSFGAYTDYLTMP